MKTTYTNTKHPKLMKWSSITAGVLSIIGMVLYIVLDINTEWENGYILYLCSYVLLFWVMAGAMYLSTYTVDDEADIITCSTNRKYPLRISKLTTVTYKETRRGRFRSLVLHDDGVGFMPVKLSKAKADQLADQLIEINPSITVHHANYL